MTSLKNIKLDNFSVNLDTHPQRWSKFRDDFSDMVRATKHGHHLEEFIDEVLGRNQYITQGLIPSFIAQNSDFIRPDDDPGPSGEPEMTSEPESTDQEENGSSQDGEDDAISDITRASFVSAPPERRQTAAAKLVRSVDADWGDSAALFLCNADDPVLITAAYPKVVSLRSLQRELLLVSLSDLARASVYLHMQRAATAINAGTRMILADLHHARTIIDEGRSCDARRLLANDSAAAGES